MKLVTILGTRPEIIKLSPLIPILDRKFDHKIIHTGQHYSENMDKIFFEELNLRDADYKLKVGSCPHAQQTGKMMIKLESIFIKEKPDLVLVQGDTNSTLSGALTASKLHIKLAHIEAGCRSFDKSMPEEVNRVLVDHCSDYLFAPDKNAYDNLIREGIPENDIYLVGNTSIDACLRVKNLFNLDKLDGSLQKEDYILFTIHRQENTTPDRLNGVIDAVNIISRDIKVVFPVHLRTKKVIEENNIELGENLILTEPLGYKNFIGLLANSKFVLTDSGGVQEESGVLNVPCLILRDNTEWKYLVELGKSVIIGTTSEKIIDNVNDLLNDEIKLKNMRKIEAPIKAGASESIVNVLDQIFNNTS